MRVWIPVECLLDAIGLPLPPVPTQWLEPYEVVRSRWTAHLDSYLGAVEVTRRALEENLGEQFGARWREAPVLSGVGSRFLV